MARIVRLAVKIVLLIVILYPITVYRDYTGIYGDTTQKRDTTILVTIHYDAIERETCVNEIEIQHKVVNQWESGFGYNFYLKDGKIYQMHGINDCTAHAAGYNCNSVSICIHAQDRYRWQTRINLWGLVLILKIKYGLSKDDIKGHGELPGNNTKCPAMDMDSLRDCFIDINTKLWTPKKYKQ